MCVFNSHLYHVGRSFHSPVYMLVCSNCVVLIFLWDRRKIPNNWWNMEWCVKNMIGTHPLSSLPVPCLLYRPSPPGLSRSESWEGVELGREGRFKVHQLETFILNFKWACLGISILSFRPYYHFLRWIEPFVLRVIVQFDLIWPHAWVSKQCPVFGKRFFRCICLLRVKK